MTGWATLRRQLGRALRKARIEAGLTQNAVAKILRCGQGKINKIETTEVRISRADLDQMIDLYGIAKEKAAELRRINAQDRRHHRPIRLSPSWRPFAKLTDLEPDATDIFCLHSERIPGPLQSELYMLRQFELDTKPHLDVTELIRHRRARTLIFTKPDPPHFKAILSESALHRMPFGRHDVAEDQIFHLLRMVETYDRFSLQILPFDAPVPFVDSDFRILRFAGDEPDFAYIESAGGAYIFHADKDLNEFAEHWQQLHEAALSSEDTVTYLENWPNQRQFG